MNFFRIVNQLYNADEILFIDKQDCKVEVIFKNKHSTTLTFPSAEIATRYYELMAEVLAGKRRDLP